MEQKIRKCICSGSIRHSKKGCSCGAEKGERTQVIEIETVDAPCQNCGKLVKVQVPFVGCVFCGDCMIGGTNHFVYGTKTFGAE